MKKWIAVLLVALAAAPMARADDASKQAKVRELFVAMHMERTMGQLMDLVMGQVQQMTKSFPGVDQMTPEQKKMLDDFTHQATKLTEDSLGWHALEPDYVKLYADTYSETEVDGILAFYKSPAGQAMVEKTPELTTGSMNLAQARVVDLQPKMKALQDEFVKKMEATSSKSTSH